MKALVMCQVFFVVVVVVVVLLFFLSFWRWGFGMWDRGSQTGI